MLRHTDPKITSGVYGHLLLSYQREAIGRARLRRRSSSRGRGRPSSRPEPHQPHPETSAC